MPFSSLFDMCDRFYGGGGGGLFAPNAISEQPQKKSHPE